MIFIGLQRKKKTFVVLITLYTWTCKKSCNHRNF